MRIAPWRRRLNRRWMVARAYRSLPHRGLMARANRRFGPPPVDEDGNTHRFDWLLKANYFEVIPKLYNAEHSFFALWAQSKKGTK